MSLIPWRYHNICLILFQCLLVGVELYLASRLIEDAMFGVVQFARYISVPVALRNGISGPINSSFFYLGQNGSLFTSSDEQPWGNWVDVICPYKIVLILSLYMSIDGLICHLNNVWSTSQDNILFFPNLSFQIPSLNNWLFLWVL